MRLEFRMWLCRTFILCVMLCAGLVIGITMVLNSGDCRIYGQTTSRPTQYQIAPQRCMVEVDGRWFDVSEDVWHLKR